MPAPYVPQTVTITDYFTDGGGAPLDGRAVFRPSATSKTPDATITRNPITAKITGGNLSVVLIASDSTGVTPQGWTYEVALTLGPPGSAGAEGIDAFGFERWNIRPVAASPAVVLRDLIHVDPVPDSHYQVRSVAGVFPNTSGNINLTATDLALAGVGFAAQADLLALIASKGSVNGIASLDSGGHIPTAQLPPIALSEYLGSVASQAAMLALTGQRGDWAIRTDLGTTWVLNAEPSSTLGNWTQLATPTDLVLSVAGKTGTVTLVKADVGLSNVDNTSDVNKPVSTATTTALSGKSDTGHTHTIANVTGLQTAIDDTIATTLDSGTLGDLISSVPRYAASSQDTLSNGFTTIMGALATRSSVSVTKLRFHVRGAVGSPGIMTLAVYKGTNRASLTKVVADTTVTTQFGSTGPKEVTVSSFSIAKGDWVYLSLLHTNAGTDPIISTLPGPPSADLINPTAAQTIYGFKGSQALPLPTTLDVSASFTASGRIGWFALAA